MAGKENRQDAYENGVRDALAVKIGGIDQWISIRGKDKNAPVLLVIHGGPGSTLTGVSHVYQRPWEDYYTVVNWDQRCSGKTASVSGTKTKVEITFEMMIQDAVEVIDYLRNRFHREKILIFGHSWGTMLGAVLAKRYPERLIAYISTGTMVDSQRERVVVLEQLRKLYEERGDKKALARVEKIADEVAKETDIWKSMLDINKLVIKEGYSSVRTSGIGSALKNEFLPRLASPEYTLRDSLHLLSFNAYVPLSQTSMYRFDVTKEVGYEYRIPVYYINGDTDWQTPYVLAKEYASRTIAPDTAFYTMKNCAHCWDVDAPEQMTDFLIREIYPRLKPYL